MDYTEQFKYCVFRMFLLYAVNLLGLVFGKGIYWVAASLLPPSAGGLKQIIVSDQTGSVTAAVIMVLVLARLFFDDGKKHAAYADADIILVMITLILMFAGYFIPVIFYNPLDSTRVVRTVYFYFYYPCRWVIDLFGADIKTAAALGMGIILGLQIVVYNVSYAAYRKQHPFVFKLPQTEIKDDETALSDMENNGSD